MLILNFLSISYHQSAVGQQQHRQQHQQQTLSATTPTTSTTNTINYNKNKSKINNIYEINNNNINNKH